MGRVAFVITTELSGLEKGRSLRGAERRSNPDVEGRLTFPWIASLTLAMTKLVRDDATIRLGAFAVRYHTRVNHICSERSTESTRSKSASTPTSGIAARAFAKARCRARSRAVLIVRCFASSLRPHAGGCAKSARPILSSMRRAIPTAPPGCWGRRSRSGCLARGGS